MKRRESFDQAAQIYDETRPSYPDAVIDWIIDRTEVAKDETLLEIGPGTGQATIKFAERGYRIHGVELGRDLADLLIRKGREHDYSITVDVSSFEDWVPPTPFRTSFIFSATAFHWIDRDVKYKKCFDLLSDNGHLVLMWNDAPDVEIEAVRLAYELLWEYYPEQKKENTAKTDLNLDRKLEIVNSGLFILDDSLYYKWRLTNTRERFTSAFFTQSGFLALDEDKRRLLASKVRRLYEGLDDVMETDFSTTVFIARKRLAW